MCCVCVCDAFRFILLICAGFVSLHLMLLGLVNFVAWTVAHTACSFDVFVCCACVCLCLSASVCLSVCLSVCRSWRPGRLSQGDWPLPPIAIELDRTRA